MSNWYAYPNNRIRKEVYDAFREMFNAAKEENLTLIVNSSYRSYESKKKYMTIMIITEDVSMRISMRLDLIFQNIRQVFL